MRRYLPLLLMSFFILILILAGSLYLPGYADEKNPENARSVTVYTTLPIEQVAVLAQEYEKSQNIHVNIVPLSENDLFVRLKAESAMPRADVVLSTQTVLEQISKQELLEQYNSEQADIIADRFKDKNGCWYGLWYDPIIFAVNQDLLKVLPQVPASWADLAKENKLRIGITDFLAADASANLLYTLTSVNGETQTLAYLKKLHPQIVQYAKFLATPVRMVGMGEADIAIAVQSEAIRYLTDSFPIKIIYPEEGTAYLLSGAGVVRGTQHKAEAGAIIDWLMQDAAQGVLQKNKFNFIPTNPETYAYKAYSPKNIKLLDNKNVLTSEQKRRLLDKWVQTVRLGSK